MVSLPVEVESLVVGFATLLAVGVVFGMLGMVKVDYSDNYQLVADMWRAYSSGGCVYGIYRLHDMVIGNNTVAFPHHVWWNGSMTTRITGVRTIGGIRGGGTVRIMTCYFPFNSTLTVRVGG